MTRTVVALYDDFQTANDAVRSLVDGGFRREDISYIASDTTGDYARELGVNRVEGEQATGAGVGAGVGAAVGGIGGLLIGLGALAIPGIGPVIAAGPLAAVLAGLAGAGAGAVAGGVLGALVDLGIPEETAGYYAEGVRRGGTLVTVKTDDFMSDRAVEIMNRHSPVNINARASQWVETGWQGFKTSETMQGEEIRQAARTDESFRSTQSGRMDEQRHDYDTGMGQQHTMGGEGTIDPQGTHSGAYGTGVPSGMEPTRGEAPQDIEPGGDTFGGSGTLGSEYGATGDRVPPTATGRSDFGMGTPSQASQSTPTQGYGDYSMYDARYRNHFQSSPYSQQYTYEQYAPAYRYGYDMAYNEQYRGRNWDEIEHDVHTEWDRRQPGTWERFKDTIRHAWEEIKDTVD